MRRKRRSHLPGFKAKVALAAIKGDETPAELTEQFDVYQNQSRMSCDRCMVWVLENRH